MMIGVGHTWDHPWDHPWEKAEDGEGSVSLGSCLVSKTWGGFNHGNSSEVPHPPLQMALSTSGNRREAPEPLAGTERPFLGP